MNKAFHTQSTTQTISDLIQQLKLKPNPATLNQHDRAALAWSEANGDKEARHTMGLWVKEPTKKETKPTLIVYIDSSVMLADFQTNHEIYAMRLERVGFFVERVEFRLSRYTKKEDKDTKPDVTKELLPTYPLTEKQLEAIEDEIQIIDSPLLKEKARKASICLRQWEAAQEAHSKTKSV